RASNWSFSNPFLMFADHPKVQLPPLQIDPNHFGTNPVTETEAAPGSFADQTVAGLLVIVIVVRQRADVDQAFHGKLLGLGEKAIIRHAGDDHVQLQADARAQVSQQLETDQLTLGDVSTAFGLAAMLAESGQLDGMAAGPARPQPLIELAMHGQI